MSDFDVVLERLLSDPSFSSRLAADPDKALEGYSLGRDERELLRTQLVSGAGGERVVEDRTTKSGVVGLLGPVAAAFGVAAGGLSSQTAAAGSQTMGSAAAGQTMGSAAAGQTMGSAAAGQTMGTATGGQSLGAAPGGGSFGATPLAAGTESFGGSGPPTESFGVVGGAVQGIGAAVGADTVGVSPTESPAESPIVATGYHTNVDVDGDGRWDAHTAYERADGGVDIHVDEDGDGVTDFIGHDDDRDGLVDVAEFDTDHDGVMDIRMYDDTGDGWMDRGVPIAPSATDPTPS